MPEGLTAVFSVTAKTFLRFIFRCFRDFEARPETLSRVENLEKLIAKDACRNDSCDADRSTQPLMIISELRKPLDWYNPLRNTKDQLQFAEITEAKRQKELQKDLLESLLSTKLEDRDEAMRKVRQLLKRILSETPSSRLMTRRDIRRRTKEAGYVCQGYKEVFNEDPSLWTGDRHTKA